MYPASSGAPTVTQISKGPWWTLVWVGRDKASGEPEALFTPCRQGEVKARDGISATWCAVCTTYTSSRWPSCHHLDRCHRRRECYIIGVCHRWCLHKYLKLVDKRENIFAMHLGEGHEGVNKIRKEVTLSFACFDNQRPGREQISGFRPKFLFFWGSVYLCGG